VSVRRTWGASRTLSDRASGSGARARYWAHSYRPDPSSNEAWTLSAAFLAGAVKNPGEAFPDRLIGCRRVPRDFHFAFTHGTILLLSREHSPRRSPAPRELALRVQSDFWVSLDPAPTLLWTTESRTVGSVCDSREKYFLELSTHTIVYLPSGVHNRDIPASGTSCLQRDVANFSA
jgi:hypothetical protein